jgi:ribonuclease VapC
MTDRTAVVDTSAIMALLLDEPDAPAIAEALATSGPVLMSAASLVEVTIVAEARLGPAGGALVQRVVREAAILIVDVDHESALDAIEGWRSFGKGRHPASLNLGDCFTYALASRQGAAVICTGSDFAGTDLAVLPSSETS